MLIWEVIYGGGQRIKLFSSKPHRTKTHYAMLINHLVYGLVTTQAMVTFSDPVAFPDNQSKTTTQNAQNNKIQPIYSDTNYKVENADAYEFE